MQSIIKELMKGKEGRPITKESKVAKKIEIILVQCPYCNSWRTMRSGLYNSIAKGIKQRYKCNDCARTFYLSAKAHFVEYTNMPEIKSKLRGCLPTEPIQEVSV